MHDRISFVNKKTSMVQQNARHVILDIYFKSFPSALEDLNQWREIGRKVLGRTGFNVHNEQFHKFEPQGASGFWLLSESHLSFHTWPEKKYVFVDLFSCGDHEKTELAADLMHEIFEKLGGTVRNKNIFKRGFLFEES